jgi:hypothetical protein
MALAALAHGTMTARHLWGSGHQLGGKRFHDREAQVAVDKEGISHQLHETMDEWIVHVGRSSTTRGPSSDDMA